MVWLKATEKPKILIKFEEIGDGKGAEIPSKTPDIYLGKKVLESNNSRYKRLLVSWDGMEQLKDFYINGKRECAIEDLVWVLDPVVIFPKLNGERSWESEKLSKNITDAPYAEQGVSTNADTRAGKNGGEKGGLESPSSKHFHKQVEVSYI